MSKNVRLGLMALIVAVLVLALTIPTFATQGEEFVINSENKGFDSDTGTYFGKFTSEGFIEDKGTFSAVSDPVTFGDNMHFTTTYYGKDGTITVKWNAVFWLNPECDSYAAGNFIIEGGTGAYENLHGQGDVELCRPEPGDNILGTMEGQAHFEP